MRNDIEHLIFNCGFYPKKQGHAPCYILADNICKLFKERLEKMYDASINGVVLYEEVSTLITELSGENIINSLTKEE